MYIRNTWNALKIRLPFDGEMVEVGAGDIAGAVVTVLGIVALTAASL